jgi:4-methylaminobutanoate oxidase (formaldehyde-forming)
VTEQPTSARAVIIGGGIVGCSTAYHLAKLGWTDTVLVERHKLTSGSTFHAAGLVGQLRTSANITQLLGYSVDLYKRLEDETGQATGWKMNGGLRLACNEERWNEVKRQATTAKSFGLEMHLLSPAEAQELWPLMTVDDVIGAAFLPTDGQANPDRHHHGVGPRRTTGRRHDLRGHRGAVGRGDGRCDQGGPDLAWTHRMQCRRVLCRAMDAHARCNSRRQRPAGVGAASVRHHDAFRSAGGTGSTNTSRPGPVDVLQRGGRRAGDGRLRAKPDPWANEGIPRDFNFKLLESDFDHFAPTMELAMGRVPALQTAGINELINGPESFTPDGNFILGEAPELKNFFVGAGFNAFGIAAGGGAGMALAEWVHRGVAPYDLWVVDIRRFGRPHQDTDWVRTRTIEAYGKHYTMAWPYEEHDSGRPCRVSPLYSRLLDAGACFGEKLGWERPNWFASADHDEIPRDIYSYERQNWFDAVGRGAPRRSRRGRVDRSDVVRQVRVEGPRRFDRVELDLREQRRQAGRVTDLHADARRQRWHPM